MAAACVVDVDLLPSLVMPDSANGAVYALLVANGFRTGGTGWYLLRPSPGRRTRRDPAGAVCAPAGVRALGWRVAAA